MLLTYCCYKAPISAIMINKLAALALAKRSVIKFSVEDELL